VPAHPPDGLAAVSQAKQFKRLSKVLKRQRTVLGRLLRDIQSGMEHLPQAAKEQL